MKKIFFILLIISSSILILTTCGKKKQSEEATSTTTVEENTNLNVENANFDNNWNISYDAKKNLSKETFDSLKLNTLTFLPAYENLDFQIGKILLDTKNKRLLTVKAIASGEISEYLLGYINGNLTDSLLVTYEDNVEYYSETSSVIKDNKITVTTISWDYEGNKEISDTITTIYNISPELTFDEVIEQ